MKSYAKKLITLSLIASTVCSMPIASAADLKNQNTNPSFETHSDVNTEDFKTRIQRILDEYHKAAANSKERQPEEPVQQPQEKTVSEESAKREIVSAIIKDKTYSFDWQGTPIAKSLYAVAKLAHKNIVVNGTLEGDVYTTLNNVTYKQALDYLAQSFNLNWREDGETIIISTSDLMLQSKEIPVQYANKTMLIEEMKALGIDEKHIYANMETGTVSVTGTAYQIAEAERRIKGLDHPISQVLILAQMIEINHGDNLNLGMQYTLPTFSHEGTDDSTTRNLPGNIWEKMTFSAVASANKELAKGHVIARPMVMMLNGQEGTVSFGDQVPVLSTTATTSATTVSVEYRDIGTKLKIVPVINEKNSEITMTIDTEVSSINKWRQIGATSAPQISSRHATTSTHIKSGQSVIIGGLLSISDLDNLSGIPGLMDLPILGKLFSFHSKSKSYGEVFIQITPYIVSNDLDIKSLVRQIGD